MSAQPISATNSLAGPRFYVGQGAANPSVTDYTLLLPCDAQLDSAIIARAFVADILQRNARVVDADTLDDLVAFARGDGSGAGSLAAPAWRLQPGESRVDGQSAPAFLGYALNASVQTQQAVLHQAGHIAEQRKNETPPPIDALIGQLRALAVTADEQDIVKTLDAVQAGIQTGRASDSAGNPVGESALRGVLEFAARMGREKEAAKVLERYTAIKGVGADARQLGDNAQRVFRGIDPATGLPLDTDRRVDAAFDMVGSGFKLAGDVGGTALLFGARASGWAGTLIGIAPVGVAIVAFAATAFHLIKQARETLLAPQWEEFRARFPFAEGMQPKHAITRVAREITGMPTGPDNAVATSTRLLELLGQNPETRARYLAFLKGKVEPDSLVDALASGKGLTELTAEQAVQLAKAAKQSAKQFLELELKDVKAYLHDRDGDRERGAYLAAHAPQPRNTEQRAAQTRGEIAEAARVAGIVVGGATQLGDLYKDLLGKLKGLDGAAGKLSEQQQQNLAGAVLAASKQAGLPAVDALVMNKDGTKLLAISNPGSEARQMVAVDVQAGVRQSVEASNKVLSTVPEPPLPAMQRSVETSAAPRGM